MTTDSVDLEDLAAPVASTNHFKFPDEGVFLELATAEGLVNEEGVLIVSSAWYAIDVVGVITTGGSYDEQGEVIEPPEVIPGHHVNTRGVFPESWEPYVVIVNSPSRIFLGNFA